MYDLARCRTHQRLLTAVHRAYNPSRVVEFGSGESSTTFFQGWGANLISLESDPEWGAKMNHPGMIVQSEAESLVWRYGLPELVLVDGKTREMRLPTAVVASEHCPLVVVHDTEKGCYKPIFDYFRAKGWVYYTDTTASPHTTLFCLPALLSPVGEAL